MSSSPLGSAEPTDATGPQVPEMAVGVGTSYHVTLLKPLPGVSVDSGHAEDDKGFWVASPRLGHHIKLTETPSQLLPTDLFNTC